MKNRLIIGIALAVMSNFYAAQNFECSATDRQNKIQYLEENICSVSMRGNKAITVKDIEEIHLQ